MGIFNFRKKENQNKYVEIYKKNPNISQLCVEFNGDYFYINEEDIKNNIKDSFTIKNSDINSMLKDTDIARISANSIFMGLLDFIRLEKKDIKHYLFDETNYFIQVLDILNRSITNNDVELSKFKSEINLSIHNILLCLDNPIGSYLDEELSANFMEDNYKDSLEHYNSVYRKWEKLTFDLEDFLLYLAVLNYNEHKSNDELLSLFSGVSNLLSEVEIKLTSVKEFYQKTKSDGFIAMDIEVAKYLETKLIELESVFGSLNIDTHIEYLFDFDDSLFKDLFEISIPTILKDIIVTYKHNNPITESMPILDTNVDENSFKQEELERLKKLLYS